jgi:hypothetical protein
MPRKRENQDADAAAQGAGPEAHGATGMAGKVIAIRCRGCSALVPTGHAWNKPEDGMSAECPTCKTVTVWRDYEVVDPPPRPEPEPEPEPESGPVAEGTGAESAEATPTGPAEAGPPATAGEAEADESGSGQAEPAG